MLRWKFRTVELFQWLSLLIVVEGGNFGTRELVFIGIPSMHKNRGRRDALRQTWARHCFGNATLERDYQYKYLVSREFEDELAEEAMMHGDMMFVDGPDKDPPVGRDLTYVLIERPSALAARTLHALESIRDMYGDRLRYYVNLDDDTVVSIPRLDAEIAKNAHDRLYMGHLLSPPLKIEDAEYAKLVGEDNCINQARYAGPDFDLKRCEWKYRVEADRLVRYFKNWETPIWALGMGMVWGRDLVDFVILNRKFLKNRASNDVQFGFWFAAIENVKHVQMSGGLDKIGAKFHDYPRHHSMFASGCTNETILVHRINILKLADEFDAEKCVLNCPQELRGTEGSTR
jgi:hypothetical protein